MLRITIPAQELFDERKNEFVYVKEQTLQLEHSLLSVAKWESIWHKAFLGKAKKTDEETLSYIRCMTITQNVDPDVYLHMTVQNIKDVQEYIDNPMSATYFSDIHDLGTGAQGPKDTVTSELIYYWMIALNIPFECEKWHLNRLLSLIRVTNLKNAAASGKHRRPTGNTLANRAALNNARRASLHTKG